MNILKENNTLYLELFKSNNDKLAYEPIGDSKKHTPIIRYYNNVITIVLSEVPHPMEENHYIDFVILETKKGYQIKYLNKTEPEASFVIYDDTLVAVYGYCNLHGLWRLSAEDFEK